MCFRINSKYPDQLIAKSDITCYKRLDQSTRIALNGLISPYQEEMYFKSIPLIFRIFIRNRKVCKTVEKFGIDLDEYIYEGLHSYSMPQIGFYIATIPAGTPYYYNPDDNEYVSLSLIVSEKQFKANLNK